MTPIEIVRPSPQPERDPLEEMQTAISMAQAKVTAMQDEAGRLGASLGEIAGLSSTLKVRCSEHDAGAAAQLDALERERVEIERRREGLVLRIATANEEMQPLLREATRMAIERDQQRQDLLVKEMRARKDALIEEVLKHWTAACDAAFELTTLLDSGRLGQVQLDAAHKQILLGMLSDMGERLLAASLAHVNLSHEYQFAPSQAFRTLTIVPARRKILRAAAG